MATMAAPDQELKKAFQELQSKMVNTTQQLKLSDLQIESLKRQIQHARLVEQEIKGIPESTKCYEGIGRMFLLQPTPKIQDNLKEKAKSADAKIKTIETNKTYLEKSLKESEDNLRELIISKQQHK